MLNDRLQLNGAIFQYTYEDQQVQSIVLVSANTVVLTENAGDSTVKGLEVEAVARLSENLDVGFNYTYLDAVFDEFMSATGSQAGNRLAFAPEHAFNIDATYRHSLGTVGDIALSGNYSWKDDHFFDFENNPGAFQESYGLVNLAAWWDLPDGHTRLRVFCDNCGDQTYLTNVVIFPEGPPGGGGRKSFGLLQRYGIELSYQF